MIEQEPRAEQNKEQEIDLEYGLNKLERPPAGDFIAGLRSFVEWVQDLVAKKD